MFASYYVQKLAHLYKLHPAVWWMNQKKTQKSKINCFIQLPRFN